jgi:hypothetical protein
VPRLTFLVDVGFEAVRHPRASPPSGALHQGEGPPAAQHGQACSPRATWVLLPNPTATLAELAGHRSDQAQQQRELRAVDRRGLELEQHRRVEQFDMDPAVLDGFDRIGDLDQLAGGGFRVGVGAVLG